ncbi:hypothetical protein E8E14_009070 [Neopestalotiopsis sp. 37M]|nr:hypothetical protein E8E14_009070 [Neopestalotiopsis sp. 37M]
MSYQWDYVPSYRLDQKGLVKYLHDIFTADSYRKRIKYETFDEDHYRVWIPRQLTKEEKSDSFLEKHRWAKRDDNPFAY